MARTSQCAAWKSLLGSDFLPYHINKAGFYSLHLIHDNGLGEGCLYENMGICISWTTLR